MQIGEKLIKYDKKMIYNNLLYFCRNKYTFMDLQETLYYITYRQFTSTL